MKQQSKKGSVPLIILGEVTHQMTDCWVFQRRDEKEASDLNYGSKDGSRG